MRTAEKKPAYPDLKPVKLKCPEGSHRVMGWAYIDLAAKDGPEITIELPCRDVAPKGVDRRHLFNAFNGEASNVDLEKPERAAP